MKTGALLKGVVKFIELRSLGGEFRAEHERGGASSSYVT